MTAQHVRTFTLDPAFVGQHKVAAWVNGSLMLVWFTWMVLPPLFQPRSVIEFVFCISFMSLAGLAAWYSIQVARNPSKDAISADGDGLWPTRLSKEIALIRWETIRSIRERPILKRLDLLDANGKTIFRIEYQLIGFEAIRAALATYTSSGSAKAGQTKPR